ncbi:hypothetical protein C9374_001000 [Naegleria lovaniensis]|uniref:Pseudouridine synthase I TruA alpha/beta domain-containing protein n=1 Tax=Naegleria lovaniensis TaxID=51637 RepID=A0AA88G8E9_NAELO|nr:uncharacterized protein C9374_014721 [Naegleria lovaniensis]XP_044552142.1 uncharacterized protein C9374_001000 [Naegleria lovaniensis]KAG2370637.1 hypothetical protein C9374_014721 [Naegleria lovaniensis]KAG2388150.1 hypothetical protein C9374_001000 [Naegleria lovaniensis]
MSEHQIEASSSIVSSASSESHSGTSCMELSLLDKSPNEMTREELVKIATLYQQEKRMANKESRNLSSDDGNKKNGKEKTKKKKKEKNEMDWSKQHMEYIALKVAYLGFNYQGLARQAHNTNTIEYHLFEALKKVKLIESEEKSEYTRCGRTDKGVSALCQVISFYGRASKDPSKSFDYVKMLNNSLPEDIRVLAWCPVTKDFDARFGCIQRTYKYFFIKQNLNIDKMREAALKFIGDHDFRNFCKINAEDVSNFRRKILNVEIVKSDLFHQQHGSDNYYDMYEIVVCGYSFLWHQIRCMAAVLFLIGEGKEEPSIISDLLDIETNKARPQYPIASEYPLVLYDCVFEDLKWIHSNVDTPTEVASHFFEMWKHCAIKTSMYNIFYQASNNTLVDRSKLERDFTNQEGEKESKYMTLRKALTIRPPKERGPKYVRLMDRPTAFSYEECLESLQKKKKK